MAVDYSQHLCPYLERRDSRCAGVLTLTNLHEALSRCAGDHQYCPTFHRIRLSDLARDSARMPIAKSA
ncbi:MAG TPA: hypothetical protein PL151_15380 [Phycisphaerae bacterium]|nr:hypothetical protein [Phycisphaerae bacterium]HOJ75851.1 hypothetical protein [Phycisphaerae bacterium]HOM53302.1 hypothetical protein [Phycisphaerae bacterium]HON65921.1 hypothetical protein [Phycisphaerae bacterium]HOQ85569.1 hypothetical protein [Phycisphaerae bacterium]